ncbi:hypothetical protein FIBSPDRAFT_862488 [Athelia psychrophila]|uniref:Uncharacterized protein n=1 Tax=Athelia psychrophila TaxID=1759441 RepID=A0A166I937_9AGAM|nr:hypothetical protein FIBSPDRAFT_862488 [Fibularhizoctonia sp. CBS 109695]
MPRVLFADTRVIRQPSLRGFVSILPALLLQTCLFNIFLLQTLCLDALSLSTCICSMLCMLPFDAFPI